MSLTKEWRLRKGKMMPALITSIDSWLESTARSTSFEAPIAQFLLRYGKRYVGTARPVRMRRGRMKHCYENAYDVADKYPNYHYAEGYAWSDAQPPFFHAWCVDKKGRAVDPTLKDPTDFVYLGVMIPRKMLYRALEEQGHWGILTGEHARKFMDAWASWKLRRK